MESREIRGIFLTFFERKGHKRMPGSSLIPHNDPTLLLTSAGMVQFKPYFMGQEVPPAKRLCSCQKCFRTSDIDSVGDTQHLTFFEMLGNFSVRDYFKKEAINFAFELLTSELKIPSQRLWVTIFEEDEESEKFWQELGIPSHRIIAKGEEDNFWGPAGSSGPCGPCSEIHYDFGPEFGCGRKDCGPGCDCSRFSEIWNLVFIQYNQKGDGQRIPLPYPNIDTGMGLERMAQVMQGKRSVFECDLFSTLVERICEISGQCLGERKEMDRAIRIVAEHGRAATFLIADGVFPQNTGRGYVLRRVVRRASVFGRKLGFKEPFLVEIARLVIRDLSPIYPELSQNQSLIESILNSEEEGFGRNLATALDLVDRTMEEKKRGGISGKEAFLLYDTYGLPLDILQEVAQERGFEVDLEGFNEEMERQKQRTREVSAPDLGLATDKVSVQRSTQFVGYGNLSWEEATILEIRARERGGSRISEGEEAELILDVTPFYGEMGGQMGDEGEILGRRGKFLVEDAKRSYDLILHQGRVTQGSLEVGEKVEAKVDEGRRKDIARNHTATHLLQGALHKVLGEHVHQAGSEVRPDHLRFDFTHHGKLTKELSEVEGLVNRWIREGLSVSSEEDIPLDEARSKGALALFGEKYGDRVRVVKISPVSLEVCGGTHVNTTSELGLFIITQESGIGAGVRRIEAVTGKGAENYVQEQRCIVQEVAVKLGAKSGEDILPKLDEVLGELTEERRHAQCLRQGLVKMVGERLTQDVKVVNGIKLVEGEVTELNPDELRSVGDELKKALGSVLIVLRTRKSGRQNMIVMVTPDLVGRGLHAGNMAREVAQSLGGGGGGGTELGRGSFPSSRFSNSKVMEVIKNLGQNFGD